MKSCALLTSNVLLLKFLIWIVSGILGRLCGIMCHSAFIANVSTIQPNDSLCMYLLKKVNFKLNKQARVRLISVFNSVRILHNFSLIFCFFFYFLLISFDIFKHLTYESSHSFAGIQLVLFAGWLTPYEVAAVPHWLHYAALLLARFMFMHTLWTISYIPLLLKLRLPYSQELRLMYEEKKNFGKIESHVSNMCGIQVPFHFLF